MLVAFEAEKSWSHLSFDFFFRFFSSSKSRFFIIFTRFFAFIGRITPYIFLKTTYFLSTRPGLSADGIRPDPKKIQAILEMPEPVDVTTME
jgi:hypothetical protein